MSLLNDGKPTLMASSGKKIYRLEEWWKYKDTNNTVWVVPKHFVTDLASIPPILFWWSYGQWNNAAIIHDWIYTFGYAIQGQVTDDIELVFIARIDFD